jgi:hypothetical protein
MSLPRPLYSVWYLHELAYIEKKAIKHKRRHKRRKSSIPWDKLKARRAAADSQHLCTSARPSPSPQRPVLPCVLPLVSLAADGAKRYPSLSSPR